MDYFKLTKEELISIIEELDILSRQLLDEKEKEIDMDFSWNGNLGHWYWNIKTNRFTFSSLIATALGYAKEDLPESVPYDFLTDKLHPEDKLMIHDSLKAHLSGKNKSYEVEYRIQSKDGTYRWFYDSGRIARYNGENAPLLMTGIIADITDKKEMQLDLEKKNLIISKQIEKDSQAGTNGYQSLIDHLENELASARRLNDNVTIVIFDIDNFKLLVDVKGNHVGDKVLCDIEKIIHDSIRETDFAGRYDGDKFMIIFSWTALKDAKVISERIRRKIEQFEFVDGIKATVSGGVQEYHGEKYTEFIDAADRKLIDAKEQGKNRIV